MITVTATSQAEAVFLSDLQPLSFPSENEIATAVRTSLHTHHGVSGCLAAFATEYGDHPETSAVRMRWALSLPTPALHDDSATSSLAQPDHSALDGAELQATRAQWHGARIRLLAADAALDACPPVAPGEASVPVTRRTISSCDQAREEFAALGGYFPTHS